MKALVLKYRWPLIILAFGLICAWMALEAFRDGLADAWYGNPKTPSSEYVHYLWKFTTLAAAVCAVTATFWTALLAKKPLYRLIWVLVLLGGWGVAIAIPTILTSG